MGVEVGLPKQEARPTFSTLRVQVDNAFFCREYPFRQSTLLD